jgi:hypothetical protein
MTIFTKTITQLICHKDLNGNNDVIFNIFWILNGNQDGVLGSCTASTEIPFVDGQNFTPYNEITYDEICQWIDLYTPAESMIEFQSRVQSLIDAQITQVILPLPWA